jgi:hypothetical protein
MKFVKVSNPITFISSKAVYFTTGKYTESAVSRILGDKRGAKVCWKLKPDGIYVRQEYIESYKLTIA